MKNIVKKGVSILVAGFILLGCFPLTGFASGAVSLGQLKVLDTAYESIGQGNAGLIPAKKADKWGVINAKGETVIPFEYDQILTPDDGGYVVAYKGATQAGWWELGISYFKYIQEIYKIHAEAYKIYDVSDPENTLSKVVDYFNEKIKNETAPSAIIDLKLARANLYFYTAKFRQLTIDELRAFDEKSLSNDQLLYLWYTIELLIDNDSKQIYQEKIAKFMKEYVSEVEKACYLFDKNGNIVWQSASELLYSCTEGVMQIRSDLEIGTHDGPDTGDNFTVTYQKIDGTKIGSAEKIQIAGPFVAGLALFDNKKLDKNGAVNYIDGNNTWENISPLVASFKYNGDKGKQAISASGGYFVVNWPVSDGFNLYNASNNEKVGANLTGGIWGADNEKGICISNAGTLAVAWNAGRASEFNANFPDTDELCYLVDFTIFETVHTDNEWGGFDRTQLVPLSAKGFKSIRLNLNEKWFLVQTVDEKWGYLSRDGKTEVFDFDTDCTIFQGGVAMATHEGKTFAINDNMEKISNELTGYTGGHTVSPGLFALSDSSGAYKLAVYSENAGEYNIDGENGFITGIPAGATVEEFLSNINGKIFKDGKEVTDKSATLCTGMAVTLPNGDSLKIAVKGDITGTGEIEAADARAILRHVAKLDELKGEFLAAADLNGDGDVDASNARMILRYVAKLEQAL
ncbi:MAG: WG repeat-containing protein [Oscillospiraceae bacterium]|nr:WG repeat-containing protein [Oscillospiraceae bacterium]